MNEYVYVLIKSIFIITITAAMFYLTRDWKCFLFLLFVPWLSEDKKSDNEN